MAITFLRIDQESLVIYTETRTFSDSSMTRQNAMSHRRRERKRRQNYFSWRRKQWQRFVGEKIVLTPFSSVTVMRRAWLATFRVWFRYEHQHPTLLCPSRSRPTCQTQGWNFWRVPDNGVFNAVNRLRVRVAWERIVLDSLWAVDNGRDKQPPRQNDDDVLIVFPG